MKVKARKTTKTKSLAADDWIYRNGFPADHPDARDNPMAAANERAVKNGCWFDEAAGRRWVEFFERFLRQTMGRWAGEPFKLLDWQRDWVSMPLFGWKRDRARPHLRRFGKGDVFVAKKQGKSTIAAGLANAFLVTGGKRAQIFGVAHTRDQAAIIFDEAAAMARRSPELIKRLDVIDSRKRIVYQANGSFYQALAGESNARGVEGINPNLILFDEIHVQRSRVLYDALAYASAARENSLMLSVSTVGVADETTIWWEQYEYAKGILAGTVHDDSRFAFVAQADEECKTDPAKRADPAQWRKAMPSLGHTVTEEKVAEAVREAENSPAKLNNLLRYLFNIPTAQIDHVIPMDRWVACEWKGALPDLRRRRCFAGLDVASSEDLTSLVLYFPAEDGERGFMRSFFWCPEDKIRKREQKGLAHYGAWVASGYIRKTPGARIEHTTVLADIRDICRDYQVEEILYDKWNADAIVNPLELDGIEMVATAQTFEGMSTYCQEFLTAIIEGKFWHDGNPVMTWCCSNVAADSRHDAIRFAKDKSADKIDGAISGAMACGRATTKSKDTDEWYVPGILTN